MWLVKSVIRSPQQEHKTEIEKMVDNIDEFPEYFNNLFSKEKNKDIIAQSRIKISQYWKNINS